MTRRGNGGKLGSIVTTPSSGGAEAQGSAGGVWSLNEQAHIRLAGSWPKVYIGVTGGNTTQTVGSYVYRVFTSSGTFNPGLTGSGGVATIDIFLVGGGSGGNNSGGGGGYTRTYSSVSVTNRNYNIEVGAGGAPWSGGTNSRFDDNDSYKADGASGSSGGSGGGSYGGGYSGGNGGSNGGNGSNDGGGRNQGTGSGQGTTTYEFQSSGNRGVLYSGGGGGGSNPISGGSGGSGGGGSQRSDGSTNLGGGGGGAYTYNTNWTPGSGGSGIVVIRYTL
jgi:hypothetical protein